MKNLKVEWRADNPWDVEVVARPSRPEQGFDKIARPQPVKATKRIIITESGRILRQCVRAI